MPIATENGPLKIDLENRSSFQPKRCRAKIAVDVAYKRVFSYFKNS